VRRTGSQLELAEGGAWDEMPGWREVDMPRFKGRKADEMDEAAQVLQLAQQTANQAIAEAQREAEEIRARARQEAEQIIADAKARAEGL
jgi:hypothetical protein